MDVGTSDSLRASRCSQDELPNLPLGVFFPMHPAARLPPPWGLQSPGPPVTAVTFIPGLLRSQLIHTNSPLAPLHAETHVHTHTHIYRLTHRDARAHTHAPTSYSSLPSSVNIVALEKPSLTTPSNRLKQSPERVLLQDARLPFVKVTVA